MPYQNNPADSFKIGAPKLLLLGIQVHPHPGRPGGARQTGRGGA